MGKDERWVLLRAEFQFFRAKNCWRSFHKWVCLTDSSHVKMSRMLCVVHFMHIFFIKAEQFKVNDSVMFSCKTHQEVTRETARNPRRKKEEVKRAWGPCMWKENKMEEEVEGVSRSTRAEQVHSYFYESMNLSMLFLQRPTHIVITVFLDCHKKLTCKPGGGGACL